VREALFLLGALALGPAGAQSPSLEISTRAFSPSAGQLTITASVARPAPIGIRLTSLRNRPLGWLDPPAPRTQVALLWNGSLDGARVHDGYYTVELVSGARVLAAASFRLDSAPARLDHLRVTTNAPFARDGPLLATLSPNGDGTRDSVRIHYRLSELATVTLNVQRTSNVATTIYTRTWHMRAGPHTIGWSPPANIGARTYVLSLTTQDIAGNELTYGSPDPFVGRHPRAPVVRVLGIDATFTKQVYSPGDIGVLRIATDAQTLQIQVFRTGPERIVTYADNLLEGVPVTEPMTLDWQRWRNVPNAVRFQIGDWPSGLYFVKLVEPVAPHAADSADSTKAVDPDKPRPRIGYAPFVVRPTVPGAASRIAVVLPTTSWQAYNFYDADGDGWGDTWYAGPPHQRITLDRPYLHRGVPPFFYRYDQGFLHWLSWTGKTVDFLAESDVEDMGGDRLAATYDLIVYGGHSEYVTWPEYDAIERFRNRGGNLMFLSSNNFFRRIDRNGTVLRKIGQWRSFSRPEAELLGVQYLTNDEGEHQGLYSVRNAAAAPWLWAGTDLTDGSTFGEAVGGYGIEIDHTAPESPPGTVVVAEIPDLFGPGVTAQMSYYETPAGAKVFSAGTMDFGGSATTSPVSRILENLWSRLSRP
jgi:hypothetical protein